MSAMSKLCQSGHSAKRQKLAPFDHLIGQLVRNSRYQQLAEGIERTDRRELERHQMGFAEWQLLHTACAA
jgi:hypothetical protein